MATRNAYRSQPQFVVASVGAPDEVRRKSAYVCDGTADDVQIQAALDEASAEGFGAVEVYGDDFSLSAGLTIPSNTTLMSSGPRAATLTWVDGSYHRIQNSDTSGGNSFIRIDNLRLNFGGLSTSEDFHGIRFQNLTDFWMTNVELSHAPHHNLVSIDDTGGSARWYINNCVSHDAGQRTGTDGDGFRPADGFTIGTPDDGAVLTNCRAYSNSHHGFHIGPGCIVNACHSYSNTESNLFMEGDESQCIGGVYRSPSDSHNILVQDSENGVISGAYCFDSGGTSADNVRINGDGNAGFKVVGCTVQDSGRSLIRVQGSDGILINGNILDGAADASRGIHIIDADHVTVTGNQIKNVDNSPGNGIQIEIVSGTIDQTLIQGNQIYSCATGVNIENDASLTDVFIDGNMFDGNSSADLTDAGSKATVGSDFAGLTSKYALA